MADVELASLAIKVDARDAAKAEASLDQLAAAGGRAEASTKKTTNAATEMARSYRQTSSEAGLLERNVGSLSGAFGLLGSAIAAIGLASFASEAIRLADAYTNMRGRLAQVTTGTAQLTATMDALFEVSQRSRTSFEATAELYGNLARATQGFGTKQSELLKVTEAINQSFIISGASAASAEAALVQLSQGFASGALRGDELNSVLEQSPRLAKAIADALGVTVGQLRKLGEEGKLAGREIFEGIGGQAAKIAEEYAKMPLTIGQSFIQLRNGILKYVGEIDQANGVSGVIAKTISALSSEIDRVARAFAGFVVSAAFLALPSLIRAADAAMRILNTTVKANPFVAAATVVLGLATALYTFKDATITVGGTTAQVGDFIVATWNVVRDGVMGSINSIVQAMPAMGTTAEATTGSISGFFSEAFSFIGRQVKDFINGWIGGMIAAGIGAAAVAVGMVKYFGEGFAKVKAMAIGFGQGLAGIFAGDFSFSAFNGALAMTRTSLADVGASLDITRHAYRDYVGDLFTAVGAETEAVEARRNARTVTNSLTDATGDLTNATNDATEADKAAARAKEQATKAAEAFLEAIRKETAEIGKTAIEIKAMEVAAAAAAAPTKALADAIREAGAAWETATIARAAFEDRQQDSVSLQDMLTGYRRQAQMIGQTAEAQARLNAEFAIADLKIAELTPEMQAMVREILALAEANTEAERSANSLLRELSLIDALANDAGRGLSDAFGEMGDAIGGVTTALTQMMLQREAITKAIREGDLTEVQGLRELSSLRVRSYGDAAAAAKSFFEEGTAGYELMAGAEQAFRLIEFGLAAQAIALKLAEAGATVAAEATMTSATLAGTAVRTPAKAAEGIAGIFAALGPWGFPVAAAAIAVMVGAGVRAFSGGGSSPSIPTLPTTNSGRGTVLGNSGDQSESISKSLEMAERYQSKDLDFSNKQLSSLKAIQSSIGSLTTAIAKEMQIGGGLDPSGLNQGPRTSGGFLGLFQNTTTSNVVGSGINLSGGQLADLIANGVSGALYQIVQTTRTNNGFFGLGGSTRTTNTEVSTGIDQGLSQEFARVLASLRDGVLTAAGQLGVDGASAVLDAFQVNLGRISFEGMSSSEINETLNAVFSAVGDDMARAILPGLDAFQRAGEGLLETLSRLATEYRVVDTTLASIGMTFNSVGLASIEARNRLVELTGGLDAFTEGASFFAENFLTEQQRIAPVQAAVTAELTRLGLATDITRTQFADLVMGLDVSTASGAEMFAALMRLAPALDQTLRYTEDMVGGITDAADLDRQRRELEIRLMEAQGRIAESLAARRADELAAMDAALRPMQQAVWAAQDMAQAAAELAAAEQLAADAQRALASQRRDLEIQLMEAQGNAAGALAARRELELAALNASLRPLQMAIYAALDLAAAADELARAQADAAAAAEEAARQAEALASQRRTLEIDLMEATGDAAGALAARRELELAALDASLRPLQLAIFAALDLAAANEALANAQAEAAALAEAEAQRVAQLAASRRDLEIQLLDAEGRSSEAVAARRALEIEALDASLRPLQLAIFAALDLAAAAETLAQTQAAAAAVAEAEAQRVAQIATSRRDLEIQLLEAQGNAVEALAARRQIELAALDDSLRPLQESIWATLDLAAARATEAQAAADAAEAARALASQRRDLDIQLLEATGDATGALAARRMDELAALDASLRPIQEAIWAALDLADANQRLADAQAEAAAAAEREAERLAGIARQQRDLDIQLMDATGNASGALAARRADELAAMDESLRATQLAIYAALDLADANRAAADAQQAAAEVAARIANQRRTLEIDLLEATGDSVAALAARRNDELMALDESLRPIQMQIYAAQDLAAANELAAQQQAAAAQAAQEAAEAYEQMRQDLVKRVEDARAELTTAYNREADALQGTIDRFRDFGASIREFRANLDASGPGSASYASTRAVFEQTASLARLGNQDALGSLTGASQAFLDAALNNASSALAYNRDVSAVKAALDAAAGTADRNVSVAEQQLAALDASVSGLITINESVLSVRDGILALQAAMSEARRLGVTQFASGGVFTSPTMFQMGGSLGQMAEAGPEAIMPLVDGPNGLGVRASGANDNSALVSEIRALRQEVAALRNSGDRTAKATEKTASTLVQVTEDGRAMQTEAAA